MKIFLCLIMIMLMLCGCGGEGDKEVTPSDTQSATSSQYIDAYTDFTGKVTIVGRWQSIEEETNGVVCDTTADENYYIFSSDGSLDVFYMDAEIIDYDGYEYKDGEVTLYYEGGSVTLDCEISQTELVLSNQNGTYRVTYKRVEYEK